MPRRDVTPSRFTVPLISPALRWWLENTSNSRYPAVTFDERIRRRRSRVGSGIFLGLIVLSLALLVWEQLTVSDLPTFYALLAALLGLSLGCVLNRYNRVEGAGALVALVIIAAIFGAVLSAPNGLLDTDYLGSYYLLALVLGIVAILMPAWGLLAVTVVNCGLILADFLVFQQYTPALTQQLAVDGYFFEIGRPIFLNLGIAFALYVLVATLLGEGRRADRAEELAEVEQREIERQRALEEGVRELLAVHVALANGNFNARVPQLSNPLLWQIGGSLNNLMNRLARLGQADFAFQRTQQESARLAEALHVLLAGRMPVWPAPSGTPSDAVLSSLQTLLTRIASGDQALFRYIVQAATHGGWVGTHDIQTGQLPGAIGGARPPSPALPGGYGPPSGGESGGRGGAGRPPWRSPQLQSPGQSAGTPFVPSRPPDSSPFTPAQDRLEDQLPEWLRPPMPTADAWASQAAESSPRPWHDPNSPLTMSDPYNWQGGDTSGNEGTDPPMPPASPRPGW